MKIREERPPNFAKIVKAFPLAIRPGVVFAYGDTIYSPGQSKLHTWLLAHEQVHLDRQKDPEAWWDRYIDDPVFRCFEEVLAHRREATVRAQSAGNLNRHQRRALEKIMVERLTQPLYRFEPLLRDTAKKLLTQASASDLLKIEGWLMGSAGSGGSPANTVTGPVPSDLLKLE